MKKIIIFVGFICYASGFFTSDFYAPDFYAATAHASNISDTFSEKYSSLVPPENSSVNSDYLFEQIALGSQYTIRLLDQINEQNLSLDEKVDKIIEKFDVLIDQNQKIIDLLEKQTRKRE